MELTVTLNYGNLDAEFVGESREKLQKNLLGFVEFMEDNETVFDGIEFAVEESTNGDDPGLDAQYWEEKVEESPSDSDSVTADEEHPLSSLARKTNSTVDILDDIIYVDHDGEEMPQPMVEKNELGGKTAEQQRNAAYLVLRVWEDCYGEDRMKTSKLKEILAMSGVSDNNLYNAWRGAGKGDFDTSGHGGSATVGLTGPGKRQAIKYLKTLASNDAE